MENIKELKKLIDSKVEERITATGSTLEEKCLLIPKILIENIKYSIISELIKSFVDSIPKDSKFGFSSIEDNGSEIEYKIKSK